MKKVFKIKTKDNTILGHQVYHVFAKNMKEAVVKVENVLAKGLYIDEAELICDVEEDKDLEEYKNE